MLKRTLLLLPLVAMLSGCAVVTVAGTAVSVGASAVGLAADAAIGTARITGKAVGAAADAVIPDSD
jgi:type IV secretory pathway TrbL component